jgi:rhodanese-related sulfurtransferase
MVAHEEIAPDDAHRRLEEFHVVDVRADHEFRGPLGRLHGSTLVPFPEIESRAKELPKGRPLLLVCRSGNRSGKACEQLAELGVGPVVNLAGGLIAWNRAQLPVEHADPASLGELLEGVAAWMAQVSPRTREKANALLRERLERLGSSFDDPTHAALDRVIDFVEESLGHEGGPPDLDLSITSFRRSLTVL